MGIEIANRRAVLVSLLREEGGIRISLDDVESQGKDSKSWIWKTHFTNKAISAEDFQNMEFDEKEMAAFGFHIFARLHAFVECGES